MTTLERRITDLERGHRELPPLVEDWTDAELEAFLCDRLGLAERRALTDDDLRTAVAAETA